MGNDKYFKQLILNKLFYIFRIPFKDEYSYVKVYHQ